MPSLDLLSKTLNINLMLPLPGAGSMIHVLQVGPTEQTSLLRMYTKVEAHKSYLRRFLSLLRWQDVRFAIRRRSKYSSLMRFSQCILPIQFRSGVATAGAVWMSALHHPSSSYLHTFPWILSCLRSLANSTKTVPTIRHLICSDLVSCFHILMRPDIWKLSEMTLMLKDRSNTNYETT